MFGLVVVYVAIVIILMSVLWLLWFSRSFLLFCGFQGWLKTHIFKPLPGKVDNISSRLLAMIEEQEQKIVSFSCFGKKVLLSSCAELEHFPAISCWDLFNERDTKSTFRNGKFNLQLCVKT